MANKGSRHGLNRAMTRIKLRGLDAIDHRTTPARALLAWREQLIADLGGVDALSAQKLALVNLAATTRALIDHADNWLLTQPSIINKRRKAFVPIVAQRTALCDSLSRLLAHLGLQRVPKAIPSLQDYLRSMEAEKASKTAGAGTETRPGDAIVQPEERQTHQEQSG